MSKLLFKNGIGKIYDDKLVLGKSKFPVEKINTITLIKLNNKNINICFFILFAFFLLLSFVSKVYVLTILCVVLSLIFLLLTILTEFYNYFISIEFLDNQNFEIPIKNSNKYSAEILIREVLKILKNRN